MSSSQVLHMCIVFSAEQMSSSAVTRERVLQLLGSSAATRDRTAHVRGSEGHCSLLVPQGALVLMAGLS